MWAWVAMGVLGAITSAGWAYWLIYPPTATSDGILFVLQVLWVVVNIVLAVGGIRTLESKRRR